MPCYPYYRVKHKILGKKLPRSDTDAQIRPTPCKICIASSMNEHFPILVNTIWSVLFCSLLLQYCRSLPCRAHSDRLFYNFNSGMTVHLDRLWTNVWRKYSGYSNLNISSRFLLFGGFNLVWKIHIFHLNMYGADLSPKECTCVE